MRINVSELLVTQTSSNNYNGYPFIKNVAAKYIIYSALKHLKVSREKLEYRNEIDDK